MHIHYNGFDFAPNECNLKDFRIEAQRSPRGFPVTNTVEAHCAGEFCLQPGEDEYDLAVRINTFLAALNDGGDFALRHSDNTNTPYSILNSDPNNISGTQVAAYTAPADYNGEWATGGAFNFVIRAEYSAGTSMILNYQETIEHVGDTGAVIHWGGAGDAFDRDDAVSQLPFWRVRSPLSTQRIFQSGTAVTLGTYLIPPAPILPRPWLLGHRTRIKRTGPRRYPQGVLGYVLHWQYEFVSPQVFPAFPTIR